MEINDNGPFFGYWCSAHFKKRIPNVQWGEAVWVEKAQLFFLYKVWAHVGNLKNWGEGVPLKGSCSPVPHNVPLSSHSTSYVPYNARQGLPI